VAPFRPHAPFLIFTSAAQARYTPASPPFDLLSTETPPTEFSTLSLLDALPISVAGLAHHQWRGARRQPPPCLPLWPTPLSEGKRSEEHTSELQSRFDLVCRLLLEKKK